MSRPLERAPVLDPPSSPGSGDRLVLDLRQSQQDEQLAHLLSTIEPAAGAWGC
jgi:hypothetical protein